MKDEISFRSLIVKTNAEIHENNQNDKNINNQMEKYPENPENFFLNKQQSSTSNLSNNTNSFMNIQNKNESKKNKVKINIKEYFNRNKQLNKKDFHSFLSFIGLNDIWSSEVEQMILWESIIKKAKNKDNIDYEATLLGIGELFEEDDDDEDEDDFEEINDKKSTCLEKLNNSYLDVSTNENCIDEYLNTIKDNIKLLFSIKFINEIFLKKLITNNNSHYSINTINTMNVNNSLANINYDLDNKSEGEGENEVIQIDNKNDKKVIININDIMNEIKIKYRFILINNEEINNYFHNLSKNVRKSNSSNNLVLKNEKKQEFYLDKELINYVSAMIEIKLDAKIKNEENKNDSNENEETNITQNITNDNTNDISNNNINENSNSNLINDDNNGKKQNESSNSIRKKEKKENNYEQIIEEFNIIDNMILDLYLAITAFNKNKDLINLIKLFNEYYIMNKKKVIYDKINNLVIENKKYSEQIQKKEESESKLNETNKNSKIYVVPNDENNYLKQQNENLKERNEYLQKENAELKENLSKNINEIVSKNNNIKISKINLQNNNIQNNQNNIYSSRSPKHFRNKTTGDANNNLMNNIINQNNIKNNLNIVYQNNNSNLINEGEKKMSNNNLINNINNNNINNNVINNGLVNSNKNNNILPFTKTGTNSFIDCNLENSHSEIFSVIGNNTNDNKFFFETTELPIDQNGENPGTPTLTPRSIYLDTKDINNTSSYININTSNSRISDINNDSSINIVKNLNSDNKNSEKNYRMYDNIKEINSKLKVDEFINKFSFSNNNEIMANNLDNKLDKKNYYDFKYVSTNKKINRLLLYNNEKIKLGEIFSDQIFFIFNGSKKKKGLLLITSQCFYVLDENNDMNCDIRISHTLLSSISLPQDNFNHLLISFSDGSYLIIEIYRRIYLLNFLKELYFNNKYKKINIYFCKSFSIKLKNNNSYLYDLKNNKDIILTPNFEFAQKFGFLSKYKDNFFSSYFTEKLVVLSSIGLIVFTKSNINIPKLIIPIIGSSVKYMIANTNEKLFCFKIKTVNNEEYIFGSKKNREIHDWMQELSNYQKLYDTKMKEILSSYLVVNSKIQ